MGLCQDGNCVSVAGVVAKTKSTGVVAKTKSTGVVAKTD
jgi:hypothetical protein